MEDLTGKQLGPYQVIEPLGEGGMAAVYKAFQPSMERYVALKILPSHFANQFQFMARFEQEAKILAQLQHPHILPVFDYGEGDGYPYIAMPLLRSGDLTDLMQGHPLSPEQIRRIISQVGDALDYAHQHGLVHRDVKPSNVLLDERGNCLLTDFGIAKIIEGDTPPADLTTAGTFVGTPAYMSPEQGAGKKLDGRSDIYSLGIVLYEMATGRVPYRAETPMAIVIKHMNDPLPLPHKLNPALPEAVEQVILKSLAKRPEDRYATAGDMVRALRAAIPESAVAQPIPVDEAATLLSTAAPTVAAESQETIEPAVAKKSTRPVWVWALAAAVVLIAVIGAIAFFASDGGEEGVDATPAQVVADGATPTAAATKAPPTAIVEVDGVEATNTTLPATAPPADPTLYDDFDDPAFDGTWNIALWHKNFDSDDAWAKQDDGILIISSQLSGGIGLNAVNPGQWNIDEMGFVEAKMMLDSDLEASRGEVGIVIGGLTGGEWWYIGCNISGEPKNDEAWASCNTADGYSTAEVEVQFDTWHTLRFELNPETTAISFFVDGQEVDKFIPANPETLKNAKFSIDISILSEDGGRVTGYFDDVRVGPPGQ